MNGRILIADDDRVLAEVIKFNLEAAGFELTVTYDGEAGLAKAREAEFDLILTDYQMPRMTGYEFCREVRRESMNEQTPIVFCSGKSYEIDTAKLTDELGVARVFLKPFSPSEVVAAIREILAERTEAATATV